MEIGVGAHTRWQARYHYVWGTKYRHDIITEPAGRYLKEVIIGICARYGYTFDALGTDGDHVHLLLGPTPSESPEAIIRTVKSISARMFFNQFPSVKKLLWGGSLWAVGYYWSTVGNGTSMEVMRSYVKNQGTKPEQDKFVQLKLL
jgi:putative transposase